MNNYEKEILIDFYENQTGLSYRESRIYAIYKFISDNSIHIDDIHHLSILTTPKSFKKYRFIGKSDSIRYYIGCTEVLNVYGTCTLDDGYNFDIIIIDTDNKFYDIIPPFYIGKDDELCIKLNSFTEEKLLEITQMYLSNYKTLKFDEQTLYTTLLNINKHFNFTK